MELLGLDYAIRLPMRVEDSLGCPRCHIRFAGSLRCDRCDFQMAWRNGILVCRPEELSGDPHTAAQTQEDGSWSRFLPLHAKLILDYTGGEFAASEWVARHPGVEVVSLYGRLTPNHITQRSPTPAVTMISSWEEIPFADRTVDAVLVGDVDVLLREWEASAFYREAYRALRPGGWLVARNRPAGQLRTLGRFRRRLEREGHRYLGGEVELAFGDSWWKNVLPRGAVEWWLGKRFTVVAGRF